MSGKVESGGGVAGLIPVVLHELVGFRYHAPTVWWPPHHLERLTGLRHGRQRVSESHGISVLFLRFADDLMYAGAGDVQPRRRVKVERLAPDDLKDG